MIVNPKSKIIRKINWQIIIFFVFRYLRAHKNQGIISFVSWFAIIGISLGVATLIIVMAVMNGYRHELMQTILGFNGHINVTSTTVEGIKDYEQLVKNIQAVDNQQIAQVFPLLEHQAMVLNQGIAQGVKLQGISINNLENRAMISHNIIKGGLSSLTQIENGVVIGDKLAQMLYVNVGDSVTLVVPNGNSTPFGTLPRMKSYVVAAIFKVGMEFYDRNMVLMPLPAAQRLFSSGDRVNLIEILLHDPELASSVSSKLYRTLEGRYNAYDWQHSNALYVNALDVERNVMFIILTLIILIASFNIITGMTMLVKDKTFDISIMRALGCTRKEIMLIFLLIGFMLGFLGTQIGQILGFLFASNIDNIRQWLQSLTNTNLFPEEIYYLSQLPAIFKIEDNIYIFIIALGLSIIAAIYPAWRAARLQPAEVLR